MNKQDVFWELFKQVRNEIADENGYSLEKAVKLTYKKILLFNDDSLEKMINELPENKPLYKDSGLYQIRSDSNRK